MLQTVDRSAPRGESEKKGASGDRWRGPPGRPRGVAEEALAEVVANEAGRGTDPYTVLANAG